MLTRLTTYWHCESAYVMRAVGHFAYAIRYVDFVRVSWRKETGTFIITTFWLVCNSQRYQKSVRTVLRRNISTDGKLHRGFHALETIRTPNPQFNIRRNNHHIHSVIQKKTRNTQFCSAVAANMRFEPHVRQRRTYATLNLRVMCGVDDDDARELIRTGYVPVYLCKYKKPPHAMMSRLICALRREPESRRVALLVVVGACNSENTHRSTATTHPHYPSE